MKRMIIHDSSDEQGLQILNYLKKKSRDDADITYIDLSQFKIEPCCGCFSCWLKTPGICVYKDQVPEIMKAEIQSDKVMYLCPVTWGSYSPALKTLQDRSIGKVLPFFETHNGETHHPPRYGRSATPYLVGYGDISLEEEALFRNTAKNLSDNIHKEDVFCTVLRSEDDFKDMDVFFEGEIK